MNKYIVWGASDHAELLLGNFLELEDYVEVFLDKDRSKEHLRNTPVVCPSDWSNYKDYVFVICAKDAFQEIFNELVFKYHVRKENILSSHEWICKLLSERSIKLFPKSVRLETCTLCQLNCPYCGMRKENYGNCGKGYLSYENFSKFIEENSHIREIEISHGGEVFLNPDLEKILLLADKRNINIRIENGTNFNTVSDQMLELLVKTQVRFITFSIDGASQEIYSIYRRGGDFNKVISNIKKLNAYKEKYNSEYPVLLWQYILMQHNECDVEKASIMAKELRMNIFFKYETFNGDKFEPKDRKRLEKITGLKYFSLEEYKKNNDKAYEYGVCYQPIFSPQINFDGRLFGCCAAWSMDLGMNVFEKSLFESLNSEKYLSMIEVLLGIKPVDEQREDIPCLHCGVWTESLKAKNFMYL